MEIIARNTNDLAPRVYRMLSSIGIRESSRNGEVLRFPDPVTICITHPQERVNFCGVRDANPFFHFMEAMAMLAPMNSVAFLSHFAANIAGFSDNGLWFNAFYGSRARERETSPLMACQDQIKDVVVELGLRPDSRQAVVMLWDPQDLRKNTKDKACNLLMIFSRMAGGKLRMTTANRSNDCVWGGVSGANIVHFSYFQEYVAAALNWETGDWWHTSNNLHAYTESLSAKKWQEVSKLADGPGDTPNPYTYRDMMRPLLFAPHERQLFDHELKCFLASCMGKIEAKKFETLQESEPAYYLNVVAKPLFNAWQCHKRKDSQSALHHASAIADDAWRLACTQWLERRNQIN